MDRRATIGKVVDAFTTNVLLRQKKWKKKKKKKKKYICIFIHTNTYEMVENEQKNVHIEKTKIPNFELQFQNRFKNSHSQLALTSVSEFVFVVCCMAMPTFVVSISLCVYQLGIESNGISNCWSLTDQATLCYAFSKGPIIIDHPWIITNMIWSCLVGILWISDHWNVLSCNSIQFIEIELHCFDP